MKIIAILGLSGSGKDTVCKAISKDLNIPTIVSHTTRPPRSEQEIKELTYHFVDKEFFEKEKSNFIEQREYIVKLSDGNSETWLYGIHKDSVCSDINLAIVDPQGLKSLESYFGKTNVFSFYISCEDKIRMERLNKRGDTKNIEEVKRREKDDYIRFKEFINSTNYYNISNNQELQSAINEIEYILIKYIC